MKEYLFSCRRTHLRLLAVLLLLGAPLSLQAAQETAEKSLSTETFEKATFAASSDAKVSSVEITGLTKTKKSVLESLIRLEEGEQLTRARYRDTQQNLKRTGLFESINFYYRKSPEGYRVHIDLKEKSTFVPIPFFSASDGNYSFGFALYEANFLGLRRQLIVSATYAAGNPYGSIGVIDPTIAGSNAQASLFLSGGRNTREAAYPDGENYRKYLGSDVRVFSRLRYRTQQTVQPSFALMFEKTDVDEGWSESLNQPDSSTVIYSSTGLTYDDTYFLEYFYRGFLAEVSYGYGFQLTGSYDGHGGNGHVLEGKAKLAQALFGTHRLSLIARSGLSQLPIPNLDELSGSGFRVLPFRRAIGRSYAAGSLEYELPFYRPNWGTLTLSGFFDGGLYEPVKDQREHFYGPGAGFRLYLSKVAIPAVGVDLGMDLPTETIQLSIVIGMRM